MNKIIIDGKEYELSAELVEKIKAEVALQEIERQMSEQVPFERVKIGKNYFLINGVGRVSTLAEGASNMDDELYSIANYCTDKSLMEQRALHETLSRLLWRYSEKHKEPKTSPLLYHLYIRREDGEVSFFSFDGRSVPIDGSFCSRATAEAAIEEVVKPFMAAHPELVW